MVRRVASFDGQGTFRVSQTLKLISKTFAKDTFYATVPTRLACHMLPVLPGRSPFTPRVLKKQVIFIHVPKAAGTSIKTKLYGKIEGGHRRIVEYYGYDPVRTRAFFKFGFVRNPWSRLLSAYSYLTQKKQSTSRDQKFTDAFLSDKRDFTDFVKALEDVRYRRIVQCYDHFQLQAYWICRPGEHKHSLNFLGRFETLSADIEELNEKKSLDLQVGPPMRKSSHGDYRDSYTDKTRRIVEDVYAKDILIFGYSFNQ